MNPAIPLPPIEDLLPHRGTMLLLDRMISCDAENACAEYCPVSNAWYSDKDGDMPAWIGIELMAQTIAAQTTLIKVAEGAPPKQGVLLGSRRYQSARPFLCGPYGSAHPHPNDPG